MQEPRKPDPNDTAKRRAMPPPPPQRPQPLRGAPGSPPPRPAPPKAPAPAGGGLDAAPPAAASESDDDLVFMTHAPGATVMPRQMSEADKDVEEFRERLRARQQADKEKAEAAEKAEKEKAERERLRKGTGNRPRTAPTERGPAREREGAPPAQRPSAQAPAVARAGEESRARAGEESRGGSNLGSRFVEGAGRISEAAGVGAIQRTLQAGRGVQGAQGAGAPSFWTSIPGALLTPLRRGSIGAALGATLLLALALLAVEVSPPVGLLACVAIGVELAALLVKHLRETGGGRDDAVWPTFAEVAGGSMAWLAAGLVMAPAIVLALVVAGGSAWDMSNPGSFPARAGRAWSPPAEVAPAPADDDLPGGEARVPDALGRHALAMLDAAVGPARARAAGDARSARQLAAGVAAATHERIHSLRPPPDAAPLSLAWRGLLVVGLLLYPIALIACARLKSAYAALHLPMLLRAVLRAPAAYAVVVLGWLAHVGLLLGALLLLPDALGARLSAAQAHLAWIAAVAVVGGPGSLVAASLLGRFYRSQAHRLGWD
jgi:hypothetical protein